MIAEEGGGLSEKKTLFLLKWNDWRKGKNVGRKRQWWTHLNLQIGSVSFLSKVICWGRGSGVGSDRNRDLRVAREGLNNCPERKGKESRLKIAPRTLHTSELESYTEVSLFLFFVIIMAGIYWMCHTRHSYKCFSALLEKYCYYLCFTKEEIEAWNSSIYVWWISSAEMAFLLWGIRERQKFTPKSQFLVIRGWSLGLIRRELYQASLWVW